MKFKPVLTFPDTKMLDTFVENAKTLLLDEDRIRWFEYPNGINAQNWMSKSNQDFIQSNNKNITDEFIKHSGIYAIWEKRHSKIHLVYIGQTIDKTSHQRVINHFIIKHPHTGSKLSKVQDAVSKGNDVGVSFVEVEPKQMRQYLEQMLIQEKKEILEWNIMGKG